MQLAPSAVRKLPVLHKMHLVTFPTCMYRSHPAIVVVTATQVFPLSTVVLLQAEHVAGPEYCTHPATSLTPGLHSPKLLTRKKPEEQTRQPEPRTGLTVSQFAAVWIWHVVLVALRTYPLVKSQSRHWLAELHLRHPTSHTCKERLISKIAVNIFVTCIYKIFGRFFNSGWRRRSKKMFGLGVLCSPFSGGTREAL